MSARRGATEPGSTAAPRGASAARPAPGPRALSVVAALVACGGSPPPTDARWALDGCAAWDHGACVPGGDLTLWVEAGPDREVRVLGGSSEAVWSPADEAWRLDLPAPTGAVRAMVDDGAIVVPIAPSAPSGLDPATPIALLAAAIDAGPLERGQAYDRLGRLAAPPHRDLLGQAAIDALAEAGRADLLVSTAAWWVWTWAEQPATRPLAAAAAARLAEHAPPSSLGQAAAAWARGRVAARAGDPGAALAAADEAVRLYVRSGDRIRWSQAMASRSTTLRLVGRHADAVSVDLDHLDGTRDRPDRAAVATVDLAYDVWQAAQAGVDLPEALAARLAAASGVPWSTAWRTEQALALARLATSRVERAPTGQPAVALTAQLNQGLIACHAGQIDEAADALDAVRAHPGAPRPAIVAETWALDGCVAHARGDLPAALAAYEVYEDVARVAEPVVGPLDAVSRQVAVLVAAGDPSEALVRLGRAERDARRVAALIPLHGGRDRYLSQVSRLAETHAALLVASGHHDAAMGVIVRQRRQLVAELAAARERAMTEDGGARWQAAVDRYEAARQALEQRAQDAWLDLDASDTAGCVPRAGGDDTGAAACVRWRGSLREAAGEAVVALESLWVGADDPAPAMASPGDLRAAWVPADGGGWWALVQPTGGPVTVTRVADAPDALVAPLAPHLAEARRIVLLPTGPLRERDLHLALVAGRPLIAHAPVVWSLDLGPRPDAPVTRALLVVDPEGNLPGARAEAEVVAPALAGLAMTERLGPGEATRDRVRPALSEVDLLHFAGHGEAGATALDGRLRLASQGQLQVGDVLALPRVPHRVVLSACESAAAPRTTQENLGVAQAFVVAGARIAVAAQRPVPDRAAARFMAALYRADFAGDAPEEAFRQAVLAAVADDVDAGAWRIIVP